MTVVSLRCAAAGEVTSFFLFIDIGTAVVVVVDSGTEHLSRVFAVPLSWHRHSSINLFTAKAGQKFVLLSYLDFNVLSTA